MHRVVARCRFSLVVAWLVAMLVAGCGSDAPDADDAADTGDDGGSTAADANADEEAEAGDDTEADAGDDPIGGSDAEAEEDPAADDDPTETAFVETLLGVSDATFAIEYEGEDERGEIYTMTFAQDPPGAAILFTFDEAEGRLITTAEGDLVTCTSQAGEWQCITLPTPDEAASQGMFGVPAPFLVDPAGLAESVPGWLDVTDGTVAGRDAWCASTTAVYGADGVGEGRSEVCIDRETGAVLRWEAEFGDGRTSRVEATAIVEPDPSWFEAPVEPLDMGSLPGG